MYERVVDIFTQCHQKNNAIQAGIAATEPKAAKYRKYNDLLKKYRF